MGRTIADELREEGRREAVLENLHTILIGVLRRKFRRVPKVLQQQIRATTDTGRLKAGVYQAVKIDSLAEFRL
jgi:hypothetical protein